MSETLNKTKNEIEEFLKNNEEHQNKHIDYILINEETNQTLTIASDGDEKMIMFTPYTTKENGYEKGYIDVPDWDFNFDGYIFEELQKGYNIGFLSDNMHYGIWQALSQLYPTDIENKEGVQIYLQYCADNGISKEYIDQRINLDTLDVMKYFDGLALNETMTYKGYVIEADDLNYDNPKENIVNIYKNKQDYDNKEPIETISLNTIGLKQNIKEYINETYTNERDNEQAYFTFVLGYDLLKNMFENSTVQECEIIYNFCSYEVGKFLLSNEYKDLKYSSYEMLERWVANNKEKIIVDYNEMTGGTPKNYNGNMIILDKGFRGNSPIALVERTIQDSKDYIVVFNYEIYDDKLNWGYGYYYNDNITKAKQDFQKVIRGGNLVHTFDNKEERE